MKLLPLLTALLLLALPARAEFVGHGGPVKGLAVSADGAEMVSASFDYSIIRWNLKTGEAQDVLYGHDAAVNAVALLPGGAFLSASDDGSIALWQAGAEQPVRRLTGHGGRIAALAVSPDGKLAASAAWDMTVRLWDLEAGAARAVMKGHEGPVNGIAFTPDGNRLVSAGADGTIRVWRVADGVQTAMYGGGPAALNGMALTPDGGRVLAAAAGGQVRAWELESGKELPALAAPVPVPLLALAVSADGGMAAAAGVDGAVNVWTLKDGVLAYRFGGDRGPVWSLAFAPGGKALLSGGNDRMIRQWNLESGLEVEAPTAVKLVEGDPLASGDDAGAKAWRRCVACHTLEPDGGNRAGPTLHNIFGRRIGTLPGYPYSAALKNGSIVWTEETVARLFELGPDVVTPGTKMPIQTIPNPEERAALIAFLREHAMER
ncbi:c-type cytochrome [Indioceanicola profundi]|uniref:c-type cytochrome n=1 Tax=Indioceanicola profundi TaxID=2220096 RepID=UPI000E6AC403|nr:c-type cytochrome [Indioceanicola profundi]